MSQALRWTAAILLLNCTAAYASGGVDRDKKEVVVEGRPTAEQALARFTTNLTALAKEGKLRPFIGERTKIRELMEVMSKEGNKVVYVLGEAGSGKTALAEYAAGQLEGKEVYSLNLSNLEAGTGYRGMLEDRIEALLEAFINKPDRILLIDEAHQVMRTPDFMNRLKPPMGRGELNLVLITTEEEYRDNIEKDVALTSRGNVTKVAKPDLNKMMNVLRANKDLIQKKHQIPVTDAALEMTAKLVMRYYAYEPMLRKALDIVDRTAAREVLNRKFGTYDKQKYEDLKETHLLAIRSLEQDLALQPNNNEISARIESLRQELAAIDAKLAEENKQTEIQELNGELARLRTQQADYLRLGQFEKAAEVQYRHIPFVQMKIKEAGAEPETSAMITDKHVAKFISTETGIPASFLGSSDLERLKDLEKTINSRVAGQEHATRILIQKLKVRQANVEPLTGPKMIILVDGPTGTGKSEWTRALTRAIYGDPRRLIQVALNQYTEHSASRLIGSDPGIVDSERGGELDALRRDPNQVVGYDEFDKAPESIRNILLQAWSEGEAKDSRGRMIDFRHSLQVVQANFTEEYAVYRNIWTQEQIEKRFLMPKGFLNGMTKDEIDEAVVDRAMELKGISPAIRNRMIKVVFNAISFEQAVEIARMKLFDQADYIEQEHKVKVTFEPGVAKAVAAAGFDPEFGARPLERKRSELVSDLLADLSVDFYKGQSIAVRFEENEAKNGGQLVATADGRETKKAVVYRSVLAPRQPEAELKAEPPCEQPLNPRRKFRKMRKK